MTFPCFFVFYLHGNVNKLDITAPKGKSDFCFPETLNVLRGEVEENIEVKGKQTLCWLKRDTKDHRLVKSLTINNLPRFFRKHTACLIDPAVTSVTFTSWSVYSNQLLECSRPTYACLITIHLLSV